LDPHHFTLLEKAALFSIHIFTISFVKIFILTNNNEEGLVKNLCPLKIKETKKKE
jgi:hypothetical protein